ncbi:MAG: tRNA pseudouridine(38-40) synthase TruA [Lachnospiraceae bacterium]|nr:tRNA pseudouridine(38-40) synthase TruA [Lachnospiraceae bacterium]
MKRVLLKVAYDGSAYHGYQSQDNGITIESELSRAVFEVTGEKVNLIGGSRTDAGVHALSNIVVFDTDTPVPGQKLSYALNAHLPEDIRVVDSVEVKPDFHPRHIDSVKTYEYRIHNSEFDDPIKRSFYLHSYVNLDTDLMKKAAKYIEGEHDFSSFCSAGAQVDSKVRTVYSVELETIELPPYKIDKGPILKELSEHETQHREYPNRDIIIRVRGNGFLYNMVRIIAGTLIDVGRGVIDPDSLPSIIGSKDRSKAGPTAPPCGLCLTDYHFVDPS